MNLPYIDIFYWIITIAAYFFLCRLMPLLLQYSGSLGENILGYANTLRSNFDVSYKRDAKVPFDKYKDRIKDIGVNRKDYMFWSYFSLILLLFNSRI